MEEADLVIIGAGKAIQNSNPSWSGLSLAKTYLQVHPHTNLVILEAASTLGGVWAQHRLHPGLKSNNMLGTYENSDFPMDEATFGIKTGEHIPGPVIHDYLAKYAERFDITPKIRFQSRVTTVTKNSEDGGWVLSVEDSSPHASESKRLHAHKLVLATGLVSEAFLPAHEGASSFDAPIFHSKDFLQHAETLKTNGRVAILGSAKSAYDAAYAYASAGIPMDWIVRESGHGPCWMAPPYVTPLKRWLEKLIFTRILTWMSPCIWGDADGFGWIRRLLHGNAIGSALANGFWWVLGNDVVSLNGYDKHPETAKLKPWYAPFWSGCNLSIMNYPTDFWELVRSGKVRVHVADITRLSAKTIHLSNGESLPVEALLCATGWRHKPTIKFVPDGLDAELGLPHHSDQPDKLMGKADAEVLSRLPRLRDQPVLNPNLKPLQESKQTPTGHPNRPYLLYHFMVPPAFYKDRSIGFAGAAMTPAHAICLQIQSLWLTAYLDGNLPLDKSEDEVRWETMLHARFLRWRYPGGHGARFPDFVFDSLPYFDLLLGELGLGTRRKGDG
ncbi:hypothetical protein H2199_006290 [Coniosporium tulheliwenetii]|uniref:Uncharacterized protein n=1 Tax=Coniosporium tulheliwenetii TaxID=3383036 RepID=A0ACC2YXY2_9PEZI|nr:hypothetical protein H2199_006290 [Cladosporium sp. JES 115]